MINKCAENMATFAITLGLLLAVAALGHGQVMGNPGTEPWSMIVIPACQVKGVDVQTSMAQASACVSQLGNPANPLSVCSKKKERNNCLKPFYDQIKKCFDNGADVDKAFKAQAEGVEFFCEDNGKRFSGMTQEDLKCEQKDSSKCLQDKMKENSPEFSSLFSSKNCKAMHAIVECTHMSFKDCKTTAMKDAVVGQINSILGETPCGEASGASMAVFAAPLLLLALLFQALF